MRSEVTVRAARRRWAVGAVTAALAGALAAALSGASTPATVASTVPAAHRTPVVAPAPIGPGAHRRPSAAAPAPAPASELGPPPGVHPGAPGAVVAPSLNRALNQVDPTPSLAAAGLETGSMAPLNLPAGWVSSVSRFGVGSMQRSYLLLAPAAAERPGSLPLVVVLHGRNLTPASMERITALPAVTGPALLVYPAGYGRSWNAGGCCGIAYTRGVDDVAFLKAVVSRVEADQPAVDRHRVYVVGFSNGGRMAYQMACKSPGSFAGIAAVEAVPLNECPKTDPVPVVIVANHDDPLLSIDDGASPKVIYDTTQPTVQAVVAAWRSLDGCNDHVSTLTEGSLTVDTDAGCNDAARVDFAEYAHGGHVWASGTPSTPGASAVVWSLLAKGTLPPPVATPAVVAPQHAALGGQRLSPPAPHARGGGTTRSA